jgi:hypothetical protein
MSMHFAMVLEQVPERGGVKVRFTDMVESGFAQNDFVRVLCARSSKGGGASQWLPEVGELGVVGVLFNSFYVWVGSLPFQDQNQIDATTDLAFLRHQSGVQTQVRGNGDVEVLHPSGARITISQEAGALPDLQATSQPATRGNTSAPVIELSHPAGGAIQIDAEGNLVINGFESVTFQDGAARFVMDALVDSFNNHLHTTTTPGNPTSVPTVPLVKDDVCSPNTFKGPVGA